MIGYHRHFDREDFLPFSVFEGDDFFLDLTGLDLFRFDQSGNDGFLVERMRLCFRGDLFLFHVVGRKFRNGIFVQGFGGVFFFECPEFFVKQCRIGFRIGIGENLDRDFSFFKIDVLA